MRHGNKINHLSRKKAHRDALLMHLSIALIKHKGINTTLAKAKALRKYVEPLITKSKNDTTHSRRTVFSYLHDKVAVAELFKDVAPKVGDRPGGYTRILKLGERRGDRAEMAFIELVDFNETMKGGTVKKAAEAKPKTRRSRSKKKNEKDDEPKAENA